MIRLKAFVLCALISPFTVYAAVNGINNDNTMPEINGNTCMMNTGNPDINEALAAQNPACHMGNASFNLNSHSLGLRGPLTMNTQYSDEFGLVLNTKFTQAMTEADAISLELDYGENENRLGLTWAHFLNSNNRVKLTVERLQQKLDFHFDSGTLTKRVPQYAFGGAYQYLLNQGMISHLELGVYYAKAQSESLDNKNYMIGGDEYINYRHIAGAKSQGISAGLALVPWETGNLTLTMNYDQVRYDQKYDQIDAKNSQGLGAGVTLSQLLTERLKLDATISARNIYDLYQAKLMWLVPTSQDSRLELGIDASHSEGHGTRVDNRVGLTAGYLWDGNFGSAGYTMPSVAQMGSLVSWAANPAVHMAQVLATVDQSSVLAPTFSALPMFFAMVSNAYDIELMVSDKTTVNVMNYVTGDDVRAVNVNLDYVPANFHASYDATKAVIVTTPEGAAVGQSASVFVTEAIENDDDFDVILNLNVKDQSSSPVPWANQNFRYNPIVVTSYLNKSDALVTSLTFQKGVKYGEPGTSNDMFIFPRTGYSDYGIQENFTDFPGTVTCDHCRDLGRGEVTLHFIAPQSSVKADPYFVRIYPTNHNYIHYGPGSPQILKVKIEKPAPVIKWKDNAISVTPLNTTQIVASWAADAAQEQTDTDSVTPITYTAVLDNQPAEGICTSSNTSLSCEKLEPGASYTVTVTASDVLPDGRQATPVAQTSKETTMFTGVVWDDPKNVVAKATDNKTDAVTVTWNNTAHTESAWTLKYIVSYKLAGSEGPFIDLAPLSASTASKEVGSLESGVEYIFKVTAIDDHNSAPVSSAEVNESTHAGLIWTGAVEALALNAKQVKLSWDTENVHTNFSDSNLVFSYSLNGGAVVNVSSDQDPQHTGVILISDLTQNTHYNIELWVKDQAHANMASVPAAANPLSATTMDGIHLADPVVTAGKTQGTVKFSATTGTASQLTYTVVLSGVDIDPVTTTVGPVDSGQLQEYTFNNPPLSKHSSYNIQVTAHDSENSNPETKSSSFMTLEGVSLSDLQLAFVSPSEVKATWYGSNDVKGATTSFTLNLKENNIIKQTTLINMKYGDAALHTANLTGLELGHVYNIEVIAVGNDDPDDKLQSDVSYTNGTTLHCPATLDLPISSGTLNTGVNIYSEEATYAFRYAEGATTKLAVPSGWLFYAAELDGNNLRCEYYDSGTSRPELIYTTVSSLAGMSSQMMKVNGSVITPVGNVCYANITHQAKDCYLQIAS